MATEMPVVRHLIACLAVIVESGSHDVTLRSLIHAIVRLPGEPFPCIREQMALYAVLTNGRGEHDLAVDFWMRESNGPCASRSPGRLIWDKIPPMCSVYPSA
jgi:hypothetical protein